MVAILITVIQLYRKIYLDSKTKLLVKRIKLVQKTKEVIKFRLEAIVE